MFIRIWERKCNVVFTVGNTGKFGAEMLNLLSDCSDRFTHKEKKETYRPICSCMYACIYTHVQVWTRLLRNLKPFLQPEYIISNLLTAVKSHI